MLQWDIGFIVLIVQYRVTMAKGAALDILASDSNWGTLGKN